MKKTAPFDAIIIIYNPNSTGDSKQNATSFRATLKDAGITAKVTLKQTKHAGHGEQIAAHYAKQAGRFLVVSSSGDGGYHELINGVLLAHADNISVGLLPSGNANDHYNALHDDNVVAHIKAGQSRTVDVIKVSATIHGNPWIRYAHSYAGIGLSPKVGEQMTKARPNVFSEKWLLLKQLLSFNYASIMIHGVKHRYTSLLFANISRMSKVIRVSKKSSPSDGLFEINVIERLPKHLVLAQLFKSTTLGLEAHSSKKQFHFTTIAPLLIQLDGEVYTIDKASEVAIESVPNALGVYI